MVRSDNVLKNQGDVMVRLAGAVLSAVLMSLSVPHVSGDDLNQAADSTLSVLPDAVTLHGPRSVQQLIVTAAAGHSSIHDVTATAVISSDDPNIAKVEHGIVRPVANGITVLRASLEGQSVTAQITVTGIDVAAPVAFRTEILAALTKAGCNMGACHGSPSGKGGFRLSLRGYDPELDLLTLRGEFFNRRANALEPDDSLLLRKPLMQVAHGGGRRLTEGGPVHRILRQWIAEGMQIESSEATTLERIEMLPSPRVLLDGADQQQLIVNGFFSDGSVRDVTAITAFDSSDESIATVSPNAVVRREGRGEATILARYLDRMTTTQITFLTDRPDFQWPDPAETGPIDTLVFAKLRQLQIQPAPVCSDADFLRRVTLDLTGRLPSFGETESFQNDMTPQKRLNVIDRLLSSDDYATFWSMKWADVLRCNSRRLGSTGVHKFRRWLFEAIRDDMPMNKFVHQMLTATGSVRNNPAAYYWNASRDEIDATETTAQLFLGIRIQCAKCHNHPFEKWTQDDYYGIAAAFKRVARRDTGLADDEFIYVRKDGDVTQPRTGRTMKVRLLLEGDVDVPDDQDRRRVFADWLVADSNLFFARSMANRVWGHMLGKGIVDPVDDFRDSNPPSNPELLQYLTEEFVRNQYSTRNLVRTIATSNVYQLGSQSNPLNHDDEIYFSHATTRLLTAEQLLDAICVVSGVAESFKGVPAGTSAVGVVDPPKGHKFLEVFGQPRRELPCQCERSTDSNLSQALQLINGPTVHNKLRSDAGNVHRWIADGASDETIVEQLYLLAVNRRPSATEQKTAAAHIAANDDRTRALEDIAWAIINSKEFLFQH
jgi:Protein of unknown function (DUF1549)/Protein of unknown function (DUF1553)